MVPYITAMVVSVGPPSNGAIKHAAIVTRVFSDDDTAGGPVLVNLTVFPDQVVPISMQSVLLFEAEQDAMAYRALHHSADVAFWPSKG